MLAAALTSTITMLSQLACAMSALSPASAAAWTRKATSHERSANSSQVWPVYPRMNAMAARYTLDFRPVFGNRPAMAFILEYAGHTWELFALGSWLVAFLVQAA